MLNKIEEKMKNVVKKMTEPISKNFFEGDEINDFYYVLINNENFKYNNNSAEIIEMDEVNKDIFEKIFNSNTNLINKVVLVYNVIFNRYKKNDNSAERVLQTFDLNDFNNNLDDLIENLNFITYPKFPDKAHYKRIELEARFYLNETILVDNKKTNELVIGLIYYYDPAKRLWI